MAGNALTEFGREVGMFLLERIHLVTPKAQRIGFLGQQIGVRSLMWLMAGKTLPLGEGRVGILGLAGQIGVALDAQYRGRISKQTRLIRGVGIVAAQTLPLLHRHVHHTLPLFVSLLGMTGITEIFHLDLQQPGKARRMGIVTGKAIPTVGRFVFYLLLKGVAIMTGETIHSCLACPIAHQQDAQH